MVKALTKSISLKVKKSEWA